MTLSRFSVVISRNECTDFDTLDRFYFDRPDETCPTQPITTINHSTWSLFDYQAACGYVFVFFSRTKGSERPFIDRTTCTYFSSLFWLKVYINRWNWIYSFTFESSTKKTQLFYSDRFIFSYQIDSIVYLGRFLHRTERTITLLLRTTDASTIDFISPLALCISIDCSWFHFPASSTIFIKTRPEYHWWMLRLSEIECWIEKSQSWPRFLSAIGDE